ncbi:MAG: hypothetical protein AAB909_03440 [Patescibacteria group bacterium]
MQRQLIGDTLVARQPKLSRVGRKKLKVQSPLDFTLEKAGIRPLNTKAVKDYMASMVDKLRNPPVPPSWIASLKAFVKTACLITIVASAIQWNLVALAIGIAALVIIPIINEIRDRCFPHPRHHACWRSYDLNTYVSLSRCKKDHPHIPDEIKTRMEIIKSRLPGTEFAIHWLDIDPIVEAMYFNPQNGTMQRCYIGVWNEEGLIA